MMTRRIALLCLLGLPLSASEPKKPEGPVVTVEGQVNKPGTYEFRDASILSMIYIAGGPTKTGAMRRVRVRRKGETFEVDLTSEKGKVRAVEPGDAIEVPKMNLLGR